MNFNTDILKEVDKMLERFEKSKVVRRLIWSIVIMLFLSLGIPNMISAIISVIQISKG